jgi:alpha/beta superfamily hydrolase
MVHDANHDLDSWMPLLDRLGHTDFSILAIDLRGHGASEGTWDESAADLDVQAAIKWVRDQAPSAIGLIGAGSGCRVGLDAITTEPVQAIVLVSPTDGAGREPMRPSTPKLVLFGRSDATAVLAANAVYQQAIGPTFLLDRPGEDQGTDLFTGRMADHAVEQTLSFLLSYLA